MGWTPANCVSASKAPGSDAWRVLAGSVQSRFWQFEPILPTNARLSSFDKPWLFSRFTYLHRQIGGHDCTYLHIYKVEYLPSPFAGIADPQKD